MLARTCTGVAMSAATAPSAIDCGDGVDDGDADLPPLVFAWQTTSDDNQTNETERQRGRETEK